MNDKTVATNRQARYNYAISESFEAGIELKGPEVKSVRAGRINLKDSFATVDKGELFLSNCHISPYEFTTAYQVDPVRRRKLLMHKAQVMRLMGQTSQKGFTIVPLPKNPRLPPLVLEGQSLYSLASSANSVPSYLSKTTSKDMTAALY